MGPSHLSRNYTQPPVITLVSRAAVKIPYIPDDKKTK